MDAPVLGKWQNYSFTWKHPHLSGDTFLENNKTIPRPGSAHLVIYDPAKSADLVIYDWAPVTRNRKRQVKIKADVNTESLQ